jgi:peroxiredoxin
MPPEPGDRAPDFEALLCDGEIVRFRRLSDVIGENGCILLFYVFAFSARAEGWFKKYVRRGWADLDGISLVGVCRDGPFAQNAFLRGIDSSAMSFSDMDLSVTERYDLVTRRDGMGQARIARQAVFVLDSTRTVHLTWTAGDFGGAVPVEEVEAAVGDLTP